MRFLTLGSFLFLMLFVGTLFQSLNFLEEVRLNNKEQKIQNSLLTPLFSVISIYFSNLFISFLNRLLPNNTWYQSFFRFILIFFGQSFIYELTPVIYNRIVAYLLNI